MMSPGQRAKKVVSDSLGLVDVAIGLSEWQAVEMTLTLHTGPGTHLAKNHESQSRTIESQFKKQ